MKLIPIEIPDKYHRRLVNYLRWATMDSVGAAGSTRGLSSGEDADGLSPEEVMFRWESKGEKNLPCSGLSRLYRYAAGKSVRDFYVSNWVQDVRNEMAVAEEFVCTGGMDIEEFHLIFKRYPDPWLLRRIWATPPAAPALSPLSSTGPPAPPAPGTHETSPASKQDSPDMPGECGTC